MRRDLNRFTIATSSGLFRDRSIIFIDKEKQMDYDQFVSTHGARTYSMATDRASNIDHVIGVVKPVGQETDNKIYDQVYAFASSPVFNLKMAWSQLFFVALYRQDPARFDSRLIGRVFNLSHAHQSSSVTHDQLAHQFAKACEEVLEVVVDKATAIADLVKAGGYPPVPTTVSETRSLANLRQVQAELEQVKAKLKLAEMALADKGVTKYGW